jgi:DNA-binding CsgD family transcriptional regulator
LVHGEPGIGKTRFVREVVAGVASAVVEVTCDESETSFDLGLVDQILARLPEPSPEHAAVDALHAGQQLLHALDGRAGERPLVIVVDDVHLADRPSLDALTFVARRLVLDRVAIVVTARSEALDELPPGLTRVIDATGGVVELPALDVGAVAELIESITGTVATGRAAQRLHDGSAGNPLHARVLLDQVGLGALAGDDELPAPRSVRSLVGAQLERCSATAVAMAGALAILGHAARVNDTATVAGLTAPGPDLADAVHELVTHALAVEAGPPGARTIELSHSLIRSGVVEHLTPARRMALHRRAALVVGGQQALRHRLAAATGPDGALADEAEREARWLVGRGARRAAADLFVAAAGVATARAEHERLILLGIEQAVTAGAPPSAWTRVIDGFEATARRDYVEGLLQMRTGRFADARPALEAAWRRADAAGDVELAGSAAEQLSLIAIGSLSSSDVLQWSRRAFDAGVGTIPATMYAHGMALTGALDRVRSEMTTILGRCDGGDAELDARLGRGIVEIWTNDLEAARADLEVVESHASGRGALRYMNSLGYLAEARLRLGHVDAAVDIAERCVGALDDVGLAWFTPMPRSVAAFALAVRGDLEAARRQVAAAAELAERTGQVPARIWSTHAQLRIAVAAQDDHGVVHLGDRIVAEGWDVVPEGVLHWRAAYAEALVAVGRLDDADAVLRPAERNRRRGADASVDADLARARSTWAIAAGDPEGAALGFDAALAGDPHLGRPFERARLELAAGAQRRRAGRRTEAASLLTAAARRFSDMGSPIWLARCERELVACGLRPAKRATPGSTSALTAQERAVAEAAAAGATNREVAAELAISARTVEHHLSRVYAKLGIRRRTHLPAALGGLTEP